MTQTMMNLFFMMYAVGVLGLVCAMTLVFKYTHGTKASLLALLLWAVYVLASLAIFDWAYGAMLGW